MPEPPSLSGAIIDGRHLLPLRVYYEDTDFSGAVYHANYLKFCERGRSDFLRCLGIHHHALLERPEGLVFMVRRMVCDFLAPARIDDLLTVETVPGAVGGARLVLAQAVQRGATVLFTAEVTVALVGADGRPRRVPPDIREKLSQA
jgi:acyl-CoA thioester hydrolase